MWETQMYFCVQYEYFTFQLLSLHKRLSLTDTDNLGKGLHHQTYQKLNHDKMMFG